MNVWGWQYYRNAAIPTTPPHEEPSLDAINDGSIWKIDGGPLLVRYTTAFDCIDETNWWYVIKDTPFDIFSLKAKRRYEINKGKKNFDVKVIAPENYKEGICDVHIAALSQYPKKYRQSVDRASFEKSVMHWGEKYTVFGAFSRESGELAGYAFLDDRDARHINFHVLKAKPLYEKQGVNAAIVCSILEFYAERIADGAYICDGARTIYHETRFQDYLEKYFGFRRAYCRLNVVYNPKIKWIIKLIYPLRGLLSAFDFIGAVHKINAVLIMEKLVREKK